MIRTQTADYRPDYTVLPGDTLAETMKKLGMSQSDLAARAGLARKTINGIIAGRESITAETALRFEAVFNVPARFWLSLQRNYDEAEARLRERERMERCVPWLKDTGIPVAELRKRGVLSAEKDKPALVREVFAWFGVQGPDAFNAVLDDALSAYAFRASKHGRSSIGAIAAWLRIGELAARAMPCRPFDTPSFRKGLDAIRSNADRDIAGFLPDLVQLLANCGVALVIVPGLKGAPVYGATRWLRPDKAFVQMSLRGKDDGHFWFTLFHELGHIHLHGRKERFLELDNGARSEKETEADAFACERLIPRREYDAFLHGCGVTDDRAPVRCRKADIVAFAQAIHVSPGVVVGRLQREQRIPYSHCNDLKVRVTLEA
jgi:HTH-type transcriptional regulator / antitoxin HigA